MVAKAEEPAAKRFKPVVSEVGDIRAAVAAASSSSSAAVGPDGASEAKSTSANKLTDMMNDLLDESESERASKPIASVEQKMVSIIDKLTPEELPRYECFRRSHFDRFKVRKHLKTFTDEKINEKMSIVVAGVTKLFIGELVEVARELMEARGVVGAVPPAYVREAYRLMQKAGRLPHK